jgi:transposase
MGKQRKQWPAELKESIVLAALQGEQPIAALARSYGVNENLIHKWKAQFLEAGRQGLQGKQATTTESRLAAENDRLKRIVAEKELELDIAKKVRRL